jgi:hypothetical protein
MKDEVDDATHDEVVAGGTDRPGRHYTRDTEEQVHDVVQDRHLEQAEQFRLGVVGGERASCRNST